MENLENKNVHLDGWDVTRNIFKSYKKEEYFPKFFKVSPHYKEKYGLTHLEAELYGYIRHFKSLPNNPPFQFGNARLAKYFYCSPLTICRAVSQLKKKGLIKTFCKPWPTGGTTRTLTIVK
jgi:DNA-binding MarR family transcriptional regulator